MQPASGVERSSPASSDSSSKVDPEYRDCLPCRVIGTAALAGLGIHALNQSRAHQPGSLMGRRVMAGVGVLCLFGSYLRWRN
ncbi:hypothetical protein C8Q72DRAFT_849326 [Fomitopsis betulina]|nr:hypothetical protein C8Q72DRAFT_849326 [Fomitopsis betulina]